MHPGHGHRPGPVVLAGSRGEDADGVVETPSGEMVGPEPGVQRVHAHDDAVPGGLRALGLRRDEHPQGPTAGRKMDPRLGDGGIGGKGLPEKSPGRPDASLLPGLLPQLEKRPSRKPLVLARSHDETKDIRRLDAIPRSA